MAVQGNLQFPCGGMAVGIETLPNAFGSKGYVHLVTLGAEDAVNEGCVHAGERLCEGIWCSGHCGVQDHSYQPSRFLLDYPAKTQPIPPQIPTFWVARSPDLRNLSPLQLAAIYAPSKHYTSAL